MSFMPEGILQTFIERIHLTSFYLLSDKKPFLFGLKPLAGKDLRGVPRWDQEGPLSPTSLRCVRNSMPGVAALENFFVHHKVYVWLLCMFVCVCLAVVVYS